MSTREREEAELASLDSRITVDLAYIEQLETRLKAELAQQQGNFRTFLDNNLSSMRIVQLAKAALLAEGKANV